MKQIEFRASSLDDIRAFPRSVMREAGKQRDKVHGLPPDDAKAMASSDTGVPDLRKEIRS